MKLKKIIFFAILAFLLHACKTTEVYSDFDPNAKFDSYNNYMVLEYLKSTPIKENSKLWIHNAIHSEMGKRGYNENKSPDLLIKVMIKAKTTETTSLTRNDNFYWGSDYYQYGWGVNTGVNQVKYDTHTEGTIIIDIIDRKKKELIWQGRASGAAKGDNELTEKSVAKIIAKIFNTYPLLPEK